MKRWIFSLFVLAVVIGLLTLVLWQSGADEKLTGEFLPRIERRLGVTIRYKDIDMSLSSVVLTGVEVFDQSGRPMATARRLGVMIRVGPLLTGTLDVSGIRIDDLHLFIGGKGAPVGSWLAVRDRWTATSADDAKTGEGHPSARPDILLNGGDITFDDGRFTAHLRQVSGRIVPGDNGVVTVGPWRIIAKKADLRGTGMSWRIGTALRRLSIEPTGTAFTLPGAPQDISALIADLKKTKATLFPHAAPRTTGAPRPAWNALIHVTDARGSVVFSKSGHRASLWNITSELAAVGTEKWSLRVQGTWAKEGARFSLRMQQRRGRMETSLRVPELPLTALVPSAAEKAGVDVSQATVSGELEVVAAPDAPVSGRLHASVRRLTLTHAVLGPPWTDIDVQVDAAGSVDPNAHSVHVDALTIKKGRAAIRLSGDAALDRIRFDTTVKLLSTACQDVLQALPEPVREPFANVRLSGTLAGAWRVALDLAEPEEMVLTGDLDNRCRIADLDGLMSPDSFRGPFTYMAYDAEGNRLRLTTGPGTNRWTPLSAISPYVIQAVLTTEDGKFERHHGITLPEIRRAIVKNIQKGGWYYGASTLTMQLAKNLFLGRQRTLTRKLQEVFFTWYLETHFTKDEILELYLNVVEFGPSIYGIGEAAQHYFGRPPYELNLAESVFLVRMLPNPVGRYKVYQAGTVGARKMRSLHRVMEIMKKRGRITEAEYQEGLRQNIVFYREGMPFPEPRMPVYRKNAAEIDAGTASDDDAVWVDEAWDDEEAP